MNPSPTPLKKFRYRVPSSRQTDLTFNGTSEWPQSSIGLTVRNPVHEKFALMAGCASFARSP
jgi:hypothetical protein